jgi:hypothetical protein
MNTNSNVLSTDVVVNEAEFITQIFTDQKTPDDLEKCPESA